MKGAKTITVLPPLNNWEAGIGLTAIATANFVEFGQRNTSAKFFKGIGHLAHNEPTFLDAFEDAMVFATVGSDDRHPTSFFKPRQ